MDSPEFYRAETKVSGQRNRLQPELCRLIIAINMDVRRLVRLIALKIHTVRAHQHYGWHTFKYLTAVMKLDYGSRTTRNPIIRCDWNEGHAADRE